MTDPQTRRAETHTLERVPRFFRLRWPLLFVALAVLLIGAFVFLFFYFPYSKRNVTESLLESFPGELKVDHFDLKYFPYPGCLAEGITFRLHSSGASVPPLVTVQKMTIRSSYLTLLIHPHYVSRIVLDGLRVEVPLPENVGTFAGGTANSQTTIGEVIANGALLEVARSDNKPPLRFDFHEFSLGSVSAKRGMSYRVAMHNPEPPGQVSSAGHIGPFPPGRISQTLLSGTYSLDRADLRAFDGIAGLLSSKGQFSGALREVKVQGEADAPDFEVLRSGHMGDLRAQFAVRVNAVNGDVALDRVDAFSGTTEILAKGSVAERKGWENKFTSLDFTVPDGRIEDILRIFTEGHHHQSPMAGPTHFSAHVTVPPEGKPFLKEVTLDSDFDIERGHFEHPRTQTNVDTFSEHSRRQKRADEKKNLQEENPPENVTANLRGHVALRNGLARLTNVSFSVPGAYARAQGTYNVINQKIDFHGVVKIDANVSEETSGIKSVFAKVLDPFFKKKQGSVVPVKMDGTYKHPNFALDLGGGRNKVSSNR